MFKVLNYLCLVEAGLGILLAIVLPHHTGYVFGGGLILGAVFTFLIGMGLGMMALFHDQQKGISLTPQINQNIEPLDLDKGL